MVSNGELVLDLVLFVALPVAVGYFASRWACNNAKRRGWSPVAVRTLRIVTTIVWVSVAVAGATSTLGRINFLSALTVSAIAGIAITLALQTTLQNMIAGFILINRSFLHMGDSIQISGIKGTVVSVGTVDAVLRTEAGDLVIVSNSNLLAGPLINYTAAKRLSGEY